MSEKRKNGKRADIIVGVFALIGVFTMVAVTIIFSTGGKASDSDSNKAVPGHDQCGTDYVTKNIILTVNGKKQEVAEVKVSKCSIRVICLYSSSRSLRFRFKGEIADENSNAPTYGMEILYFLEGYNSKVGFANPFKDGYCKLRIAYYKETTPVEIKEEYVFNPKR